MTSNTFVQVYTLGDLAPAIGQLGLAHSNASPAQIQTATRIVTDVQSYTDQLGDTVVCVEDRLHRPDPRLAGGAVSLALMHHFLYGGHHLSQTFAALRNQGFRLALHDDCGALKLMVRVVLDKLTDVDAEAYQLLATLGVDVSAQTREVIAKWASTLPEDYVDLEAARAVVDEIDQIEGEHNAVFAVVSLEDGVSFVGGPRLKQETDGLLAFGFDPWVARRAAQQMIDDPAEQLEAETVALAFTAQVFLTLGGTDLKVAIHK